MKVNLHKNQYWRANYGVAFLQVGNSELDEFKEWCNNNLSESDLHKTYPELDVPSVDYTLYLKTEDDYFIFKLTWG